MAKKTWMGRAAGVLLPVSSLPSKYGIGNFGQAAREWVDFLVQAEQRYWQVLPLGPTSYGDSPYQSFSAFAGKRERKMKIKKEEKRAERTQL